MTFLSGLDLGPRRAAPLDRWTPPWVASVGPKVHTGIGVGPGPALGRREVMGGGRYLHLVPQARAAERRPGGPLVVGTGLSLALHRYRGGAESSRRPGTVAVLVFFCMSPRGAPRD